MPALVLFFSHVGMYVRSHAVSHPPPAVPPVVHPRHPQAVESAITRVAKAFLGAWSLPRVLAAPNGAARHATVRQLLDRLHGVLPQASSDAGRALTLGADGTAAPSAAPLPSTSLHWWAACRGCLLLWSCCLCGHCGQS